MIRWGAVALSVVVALWSVPAAAAPPPVPMVYCTDLYHPHNDPDDHYDLLTLCAMPEFDIRGVVIDADAIGKHHAAVGALRQAMALSRRTFPFACGLTANLSAPQDAATRQPKEAQEGVELTLRLLREATDRVTLFATGSLRDFAAAYNREPALFAAKVARMYVNAGHSDGENEWNVEMDRLAYVRIMRSGLPVYWIPCFGARHGSHWKFRQESVLTQQDTSVQNFFLYMLTASTADPLTYLRQTPDAVAAKKFWSEDRHMWCTAAFLDAAGRTGETWAFAPEHVQIDDSGATRIVESGGVILQTFEVRDPQRYEQEMTETLTRVLRRLPAIRDGN